MPTTSLVSFSALLRRHRLRAGLTQEALAERAGLSTRGVQDLERGIRASPRAETVRMLADALELPSEERAELVSAAHPDLTPPPVASGLSAPRRLPVPPTPLVGREREVANACAVLRQSGSRLLTLTGPGGIGKTRLALAIASEVAADFPDGVAWLELAPLADPTLVANAVARALGVDESGEQPLPELLALAVAERHLLLVIDNCEHLLAAMPLFSTLLAASPRLAILATSRARLRLRGERELPVAPLAVPALSGSNTPPLAGLAGVAAVRLFVERAVEVRPDFALRSDNAAAVAAICQQLEGLPLALELAAARIKTMPPQVLLARLGHRLPLLTGGARDAPRRQQTMRDAIAWSHDLLREEEQLLFRRVAVFAGGFTLEAAEWVSEPSREDPSPITLDAAAGLIDHSLLRLSGPTGDAGDARFAMLETVREYALERLAASGEEAAVRQAHTDFYLALAERADAELTGPAQAAWLDRLEAEHDNLRAAITCSLEDGRATTALRLAAALARFWRMHGHPREGLTWLERALTAVEDAPPVIQARALEGAGRLAHDLDAPSLAATRSEAALALWRALGDLQGQSRVLDDLGNIAHDRGDFTRAVALHEEALVHARAAGDRRGAARALNNLGMVALYQSQDEQAGELYQEALALLRELGDAYGVNIVLNNLGIVAIRRGELDQAAALYDECLEGSRQLGDQRGIAGALANLGEIRLYQGDITQAEALYEEARRLLTDLGDNRAAAAAFHGLASVALAEGDETRAASLFRTSLALAHEIDDKMSVADSLEGVAAAAVRRGDAASAAHLLGAAAALRDSIEAPVAVHRRGALEQIVATCRAALKERAYDAAWDCGRAWTMDRTVSEAIVLAERLAGSAS